MRALAGLLAILAILLAASALRAQPVPTSTRDVRALDAGLVVVDTIWSERGGRRSARITASLGGRTITLHDGATVRTALAASGDALLIVAWHGGDRAFARAILAHVAGGALVAGPSVEIAREAASTRRSLRPGSAVATATPGGFTIVLQEQDTQDAQADVVTTMTRIARDGSILQAPAVVPIPWALAALGWNGAGYHLAVLWGGWGREHAGTARICLVTLGAEGTPQQHPWWASPFDAIGEVQIVALGGAMQVIWRSGDGRTILRHDARQAGRWSVEPPAPSVVAQVDPAVPFAAIARDGAIAVVTP